MTDIRRKPPDQGEHDKHNALLRAYGYTWRKIIDRVHRGRTYSHWALIGPDGKEIDEPVALARIALTLRAAPDVRKRGR